MKRKQIIVAVAVISALSLIAGICCNNEENLQQNHKAKVKHKAEVIKKCESKKQEKIPVKINLTESVNNEQKEEKEAGSFKPEENNKENPERISASRNLFYPGKHKINYPEPKNFEKYYGYALDIYEYATKGEEVGELVFDNAEDMYMFQSKTRATVLNNSGIPILESFAMSYEIVTAKNAKLKPMNLGHEEYRELKEVENFILSIAGDRGVTDLELIEILNRWLTNNTSYDYEYKDISYSELGVIRNREAVCDGYADFIKAACDLYEVPCEKVIGYVGKGLHAWNRVRIGGVWYYIDTTWNVCNKSNEYYLTKNLWSDHTL